MRTGSIPRCSTCGAELSAAARGMCASCLLRTALSLEDGAAGYRILTVIGGDADAVTYLAEPASGRVDWGIYPMLTHRSSRS